MSVSIEVDITVECDECGSELEADFRYNTLTVEPCETCLDGKYNEGHQDGKTEGYDEAKEEFEKAEETE